MTQTTSDSTSRRGAPTPAVLLLLALCALLAAVPAVAQESDDDGGSFWDSITDWFDGDDETDETDWTDGEELEGVVEIDPDVEPTGDDPLGYICSIDGREKEILPSDALWLAKMVDGETGGSPSQADADAMLWTIVQRTDLPSFQNRSVEYLTRRYSQPINQRWTRTGDRCRRYYADDFTGEIPDNCSPSRTARRARNIAKGWDEIDELARRSVLELAAGQVPNPVVGSIGWFDSAVWRRGETNGNNDNRELIAEIERNTYYARRRGPDTRTWDEWTITVVPAGALCPDFVGEVADFETDRTDEVTR